MAGWFVLIGWIVCAAASYGISVAHFQRHYPALAKQDHIGDRVFSALTCILGPFALFGVVLVVGLRSQFRHGWML